MRTLNPEHAVSVMEAINKTPYLELLDARLTEFEQGFCRIEMQINESHLNTMGHVHGGVYASLIDGAAAWSLYCDLDEEVGFTTLDLHVDDLARSTEGMLVCEGRPIKVGSTICLTEAFVIREDGKKVAYGTSKCFVSNTLPNAIEDLSELFGKPLPNKFLPFEKS